jgi:uncharacterized protein (DUF427 family)
MKRDPIKAESDPGIAPLDDDDHVRGPASDRLILEYGDYECPYSRQAFRAIERVEQQLSNGIRFAFRHFPLVDIHPHALAAASAAEAASLQDRFWDMHSLLYHRQKALADDDLRRYAAELGLDVARFVDGGAERGNGLKGTTSREVRLPGPDHDITIEPSVDRVVVGSGGLTLADSQATLVLRETNYPSVRYIPLADVDQSLLTRSDLTTYCPYKGDASYYSIVGDDDRGADAVWFYEQPYPAVAAIKDHVAFYSNRVDITVDPDDDS